MPPTTPHEAEPQPFRRPTPCDPPVYSVSDFCKAHAISRGTFYKLLRTGRGPSILKVGRRTLITREAAERWRFDTSIRTMLDREGLLP